jgi:hypothetical protein
VLRSASSASPSCRSCSLPAISVWTGAVGPASVGWKSSCCISLGSVSPKRNWWVLRSRLHLGPGRGVHRLADRYPFQLEVGVANLAVGILGVVAMGRRDGFREATVIAAAVFGVGATVVHVMDVIESGNLAPGNTIQNVSNLLRPALLIAFLAASRRAERSPDSGAQTAGFDQWREPRIRAAGMMTGSVAAGFGAGFAIDLPLIGTLVGSLVGTGLAALVVARASGGISARRTDPAS